MDRQSTLRAPKGRAPAHMCYPPEGLRFAGATLELMQRSDRDLYRRDHHERNDTSLHPEHPGSVHDRPIQPDNDESKRFAQLGKSSYRRFEALHDLEDLNRAVDAQERAVELMHEGHSQMLELLADLGLYLWYRFDNLGKRDDIERAISVQQCALELTPKGHPDLHMRLGDLASSLWSRFNHLGGVQDLENAIGAHKQAVDLMPKDHREWPMQLGNLANSLRSRFERLGEVHDLEKAIVTQKQALDLMPKGHPERPRQLGNLANSLHSRFERLGEVHDLEEAIVTQKQALDITPKGHPERPMRLGNLANSLQSRFERLGGVHDLEKAIVTQKQALDLMPKGHPERPRQLSNHANSLQSRFERLGEVHDLEEAIVTQKQALDITPKGYPEQPMRLGNLANFLQSRFEALGKLHDLEEAIVTQKQALDITPKGHPERPRQLSNLANSLQSRFKRLGELHDLQEAIKVAEIAVKLTPEGHPWLVWRLHSLGWSWKYQLLQKQNKLNFDAAMKCFMSAALQTLGDPTARLKSARQCVRLLSKYPQFSSAELVLAAHSSIIQIFPELVWLGHSLERRYEESAKLGDLVNAAISAFIVHRSNYQAIEWMEAGRTLIWSQVFSLREPLGDLAKLHPDLADELRRISFELQRSGSTSHSAPRYPQKSSEEPHFTIPQSNNIIPAISRDTTITTAIDHHRRLAIDYQRILKDVRSRPGFEGFLLAPKIETILTSIEHLDGPVMFVNVHSSSCDALALFPNGGIRHVVLRDLTESKARALQSTWAERLQSSDLRMRGALSRDRLLSDRTNTLGASLECVWKWIVHPILEALDLTKNPPSSLHRLPHVTWCPMGPLTQLPFHAAGIYNRSQADRSHVYDFVVSSYTPSLATLLRCHKRPGTHQRTSRPNVLVIAQPKTPDYAELPNTRSECDRLRAVMPDHAQTVLIDKQGTVERTLAAMSQHPWVHIACHGTQSVVDPTQSKFALYDGPLTLAALMSQVADNAELAFLSACETAVGNKKIPEESAHLAAGMLAVGFKGVVGTMWSIYDADAPIIVEAYYERLHKLRNSKKARVIAPGYTGSAYALHWAAKILRERVGEQNFLRWAPFVHFGI